MHGRGQMLHSVESSEGARAWAAAEDWLGGRG